MFRRSRSLIASLVTALLTASVLVSVAAPANALQSASTDCAAGNTEATTKTQVTPSHGNVFYIDTGISPKLDAAYVGYSVKNTDSVAKTNIWVRLTSFTGTSVSLVNSSDADQQITSIDPNDYKTAFFLLKATASTTTAQTHTVQVFQGKPGQGGTLIYNCKFTFIAVEETIKAAANKVTSSLVSTVAPSPITLGGLVTVEVQGNTGTIGQGTRNAGSIFWATPAALSNWPTRSLRLESTRIEFYSDPGRAAATELAGSPLINKLLLKNADTFTASKNTYYTAKYTFRIIGGGNDVYPMPIGQIASGTQIKHTDTGSISGGLIALSGVTTAALKTEKTAVTKSATVTGGNFQVTYTVKVSTTSSTPIYVDEIVDEPSSIQGGITTVSAKVQDLDSASPGRDITGYVVSGLIRFAGPFRVDSSANGSAIVQYALSVPCSATATTNKAYAMSGDTKSGYSQTAYPQVTITGTASGGTCTPTITNGTSSFASAVTQPASGVSATGATLNGVVNAQGKTGCSATFTWGTSSSLSGAVTVSATGTITDGSTDDVNVTYGISSALTVSQTYYFRVTLTCTGPTTTSTASGSILSFTVPEVIPAPSTSTVPSATTNDATNVRENSAVLNGEYDTAGKTIDFYIFEFATLADHSDATNLTALNDATNSTLSFSKTGLLSGKTYYYRVRIDCRNSLECPTSGSAYGDWVSFTTLKITKDSLPDGTAGSSYPTQTLTGTGGCSPYSWSVTTGSLPAGLNLNSTTGEISGTPTASGSFTITVTMTDSCSKTTTKDYTFTIAAPPAVSLTTPSMPDGTKGDPYSKTLDGSGGCTAYSFTITAGALPAGLSLSGAVISGTPTESGTFTITVRLTDACGQTDTKVYTFTINNPAPVFYGPYPQTITFPPVNNMPWGNPNPSSNPTASSGLPVTVTNNTPSVCTWNNGVITILSTGTCSLTATQPGNGYWLPAAPVTITFEITKKEAVVTVDPATKQQGQVDPTCTYVITGLANGVTVTGITCSRTPGETPGTYPVTPAGGNFPTQYIVIYRPGNLTVTAPQSVAPSPGGNYTPITMNLTNLTWQPSPTIGATYQVNLNGRPVCTTAATNCSVNTIVGPKSRVEVQALLAQLKSPLVSLRYQFDKPIVAVTVYFDVDKSKIKPADAKEVKRVTTILAREGFNKFNVDGHTDSDASASYNLALSARRNVALKNESTKLLPKGNYDLTPHGYNDPAADNNTAAGKAKNRRATLFITG